MPCFSVCFSSLNDQHSLTRALFCTSWHQSSFFRLYFLLQGVEASSKRSAFREKQTEFFSPALSGTMFTISSVLHIFIHFLSASVSVATRVCGHRLHDHCRVICACFPTSQPALQTSTNICTCQKCRLCEKCLCPRSYASKHLLNSGPSESRQALTKADFFNPSRS